MRSTNVVLTSVHAVWHNGAHECDISVEGYIIQGLDNYATL